MFNTVQIICASERDRLMLRGIFKDLGADAVFSPDLNDALAIMERTRPAAVFLADGEDPPPEIQLRELHRLAPFVPVIPLLKHREAARAVALMKAGAFECVQHPWTAEAVRPLYRKALGAGGTRLELDTTPLRARRRTLAIMMAAFCAFTGFAGGLYLGWKKYTPPPEKPKIYFALPYSHPTGIIPGKDSVLISDWHTQGLYEHSLKDFNIQRVTSLPETMPVAMAASGDTLWLANADGTMEKRLQDARYTLLTRKARLLPPPDGACFDGLYLWTTDMRSGVITKRLPLDDLPAMKTYKYPGARLEAFACDKRFLWAADPGMKALVKLQLDDPETVISTAPLAAYASPTAKVTALASKDGRLWFAGSDNDKGFIYYQDEK